jgi:hypothetical protein
MPVTTETPPITRISTAEKTRDHSLLMGVAISSFAALLLELALTRLNQCPIRPRGSQQIRHEKSDRWGRGCRRLLRPRR